MLKKRIIPLLLLKNNKLVKTKKFEEFKNIGNPVSTAKIFSDSDADELIFLNINKEKKVEDLINHISKIVEKCFIPLSAGGGIKSLDAAIKIIKSGADKIILNTICYKNKKLLKEIINKLGGQAVIASIDVKFIMNKYVLFSNNGKDKEEISLEAHLEYLNEVGVGEVLINSIDLEGTMIGPDLKLNSIVSKISESPIIYSGGIGNYDHIKNLLINKNTSAVACGSIFNFTNTDPIMIKSYLMSNKLNIRIF